MLSAGLVLGGCPTPGPCDAGSKVAPPKEQSCQKACPTSGGCRACCENSGLVERQLTICEDNCPRTGTATGSITPASPQQVAQIYAAIPNDYLIRIQVAELAVELQGFLESMSSDESRLLLEKLGGMNNDSWMDLQYLSYLGLPHFVELVKIGLNGESLDNQQARFKLYRLWINEFMAGGSGAQIDSLSSFLR